MGLNQPRSTRKTRIEASRMLKSTTAKAVSFTSRPRSRPIWRGTEATTAAARPLGFMAPATQASKRVQCPPPRLAWTTGTRTAKRAPVSPSPARARGRLESWMERPT